jgi:beta-N-acetylhexosaminidase
MQRHAPAFLAILILIAGCSTTIPGPPGPVEPVQPVPPAGQSAPPPVAAQDDRGAAVPSSLERREAGLERILATLDDRALVGQMLVIYRAENAYLLEHGFGGVLLFRSMLGDPARLRAELDALQGAAPVGYLVALDQEGGRVSRLDAVPGWKDGTASAAEMAGWPPAQVRAEGERVGRALADLGVNLNLAPVLDSAEAWDGQPSWIGRRERAFGSSDASILPPARAFAQGCRDAGIASLSKHFPGYDVAENSDLEPARSGASDAAIAQAAGRFAALADATVGTMMASVIYPPLGPEPAVLNPEAVARARAAVGDDLIMTDDLWGTALRAWQRPDLHILPAEYPDADWLALGERAVRAGNDLLLITYPAKAALLQEMLAARLAEDPRLRVLVRAAVRRILRVKADLGLVEVPGR